MVHEPEGQERDVTLGPGADPDPDMAKFVLLKTRSKASDPHFGHSTSLSFSDEFMIKISKNSLHFEHLNS